jgi:hypothetical protein
MKRINSKTNKPFTRGDTRTEDARIFKGYLPRLKKDGTFQEEWLLPESFAKIKEKQKILSKKHYEHNKELTKERAKAWALANPEKRYAIHRKNREKDLENHNARNREWNKNNKPIKAALQGKRKAAQLQRTPKWLTESELRMIEAKYSLAAMLTRETGIIHHVDHIIPLQGKKVSGLHVFSNLRVIPGTDNVKKSNSYQI